MKIGIVISFILFVAGFGVDVCNGRCLYAVVKARASSPSAIPLVPVIMYALSCEVGFPCPWVLIVFGVIHVVVFLSWWSLEGRNWRRRKWD